MFFTFLVICDLLNHLSKLMKLKAVLHQPNTDDQTLASDLIQSLFTHAPPASSQADKTYTRIVSYFAVILSNPACKLCKVD